MGGYAVFLAPIAGIIASDFWIVKKREFDIPALYDPFGRYRYWAGINWRALVAFLFAVGPNLPGLALSITPTIQISDGAANLYTFDWLYGFVVSIFLYSTLSYFFPAKETLVETTIYGRDDSSQLSDKEHPSAPNYEKDFGNVDAVKMAQDVNYPQEKI
jgi:NCS1 family nucleobase:cation symporter-1